MSPQETTQTAKQSSLTKEILKWKAPLRPFKRRDREFLTTVFAVAFLVGIIAFVLGGFLPVVVILSLVFLVFVFSTISPEEVEHKITNKGILFAGKSYSWNELISFWITERFGNHILVLQTTRIPGRLELVFDPKDKEVIKEALEKHLEQEEAQPVFMDKAAAWLSKRVPLE